MTETNALHLVQGGKHMGFLEGILGGVVAAEALPLVKGFFEKRGGPSGVVADFERNGFGQQAKSWVSTGPNSPITPEQVHRVFGMVDLKALANQFGVPVDKVTELLAKYLPTVIDKATPGGKLPA